MIPKINWGNVVMFASGGLTFAWLFGLPLAASIIWVIIGIPSYAGK